MYDVALIGTGLGGLPAGALLANAGCRVLLLEKLGLIGNCWTTYDMEGFKMPARAIAVHYFGTELEKIFHDVGKTVNFIPVPKLRYRGRIQLEF